MQNFEYLREHLIQSSQKLKLKFTPKLIILPSNAIAAGTAYLFVFMTTSLLRFLDESEQFAVLDHELGHVKNWNIDFLIILYIPLPFLTLIMLVLNGMPFFPTIPLAIILIPIFLFLVLRIGMLKNLSLMKVQAEYEADRYSVKLGNEKSLCSALNKFQKNESINKSGLLNKYRYIVAKFYFSNYPTHPSVDERVDKIKYQS